MNPLASNVHIDAALSNFSLGYRNNNFIADEIAPVVPVGKKSDYYFIHGKEKFDVVATKRAPQGNYARVQHAYSNTTYMCDEYGLEHAVFDDAVANADPAINPMQGAASLIMDLLLLRKEVDLCTEITSTTPPTENNAVAAADRWNQDDSDPLGQIEDDKKAIKNSAGFKPNRLLLGNAVFNALVRHPQMLGMISGGSTIAAPAIITAEFLARAFGVDKIIVPDSIKNSAKQGQTATLTDVWGKIALLFYYPGNSVGLETPAYALQFQWTGDGGGMVTERYREEQKRAEILRTRFYNDQKVTGAAFAALRTTVVD
jgi:hypothetical protein